MCPPIDRQIVMTSPFYADVLQCSQEGCDRGILIQPTKAAAVVSKTSQCCVICCVRPQHRGGGGWGHLPTSSCPTHLICSVSVFVQSSFEDRCWWGSVCSARFRGKLTQLVMHFIKYQRCLSQERSPPPPRSPAPRQRETLNIAT